MSAKAHAASDEATFTNDGETRYIELDDWEVDDVEVSNDEQ